MSLEIHMCKTCGKTSPKMGHLCDPIKPEKVYTCEHCKVATDNPRRICRPKPKKRRKRLYN